MMNFEIDLSSTQFRMTAILDDTIPFVSCQIGRFKWQHSGMIPFNGDVYNHPYRRTSLSPWWLHLVIILTSTVKHNLLLVFLEIGAWYMVWLVHGCETFCRNSYQGFLLLTRFNRISNHESSKVSDEFTYPFPNFNDCTVEVWEWISNFAYLYNGCNYLSMFESKCICINDI